MTEEPTICEGCENLTEELITIRLQIAALYESVQQIGLKPNDLHLMQAAIEANPDMVTKAVAKSLAMQSDASQLIRDLLER